MGQVPRRAGRDDQLDRHEVRADPAGRVRHGLDGSEEVAKLLEEAKATNRPSWYIDRLPAEAPKHRVRITKPFYLGSCEVTQAQYERVMGSNPSRVQGAIRACPVEMVSWDEASAFCRKLGRTAAGADGRRAEYRLADRGRVGVRLPGRDHDDVVFG